MIWASRSTKNDPELTQIIELSDNGTKTIITTIFRMLKRVKCGDIENTLKDLY